MTRINGVLKFKILELKKGEVLGKVFEYEHLPDRDDFFTPNGDEVEFGGSYQQLGDFNDAAWEYAKELYYLGLRRFNFKLPVEYKSKIKPLKVGNIILVEFKDEKPVNVVLRSSFQNEKFELC